MFTIHLPPLRERGDDLPMLVHHYIRTFNRELGRDVRRSLDPERHAIWLRYSWPGNIRELQSVLKQALLRATGFGPGSRVSARSSARTANRDAAVARVEGGSRVSIHSSTSSS